MPMKRKLGSPKKRKRVLGVPSKRVHKKNEAALDSDRVVKHQPVSLVKKRKTKIAKTDKVSKVAEASKKELTAEYDAMLEAEAEYFRENVSDEPLSPDHVYSSKDYKWRRINVKDVSVTGRMYKCNDPVFRWVGYDLEYITDPVSKKKLRRVKTYDQYASDLEFMWKADRRVWFKDLEAGSARDAKLLGKLKQEGVLPIEYFSTYNEGVTVVLTSFGPDGMTPCNPTHRETK